MPEHRLQGPCAVRLAAPKAARASFSCIPAWAFTVLNSLRLLAYQSTQWLIVAGGDSSQHSLWTWLIWTGANLGMAAWLCEQNTQRIDRAAALSLFNGLMCLLTAGLILYFRVW
jgi:hypothetical protein